MITIFKVWWHSIQSRSKSSEVQEIAVQALGELGNRRAVDALIRSLGNKDIGVCKMAAKVLAGIDREIVVEPLIGGLGNKISSIRERSASVLGEIGDERAVKPLIGALADEKQSVRCAAAKSLGSLGDERAVEPLINLLGGKRTVFQKAVAIALGRLGDRRAVEPLITLLKEMDEKNRGCIIGALKQIAPSESFTVVEEAQEKLGKVSIDTPRLPKSSQMLIDYCSKITRERIGRLLWLNSPQNRSKR